MFLQNKTQKKLKIGVLFTAYNCADYIDESFQPWLNLRKELNLVLAAANGRFIVSPKESSNIKGSHSLLKLIGKDLDYLLASSTKDHFWTEEQSHNYLLNYALDQKVDLVWMVDADECYTEKEIKSIINYVQENPSYNSYHVQFKNYVFQKPYWQDGFNKSVIYWTNKNQGLQEFYFDNDIIYKNGLRTHEDPNRCIIPKNIAFVKHYSWLEDDSRTKDKIIYQNIKYSGEEGAKCGFKYNKKNRLVYNRLFFEKRGIEMPIVHNIIKQTENLITTSFDRSSNEILLSNLVKPLDFDFFIYDSKSVFVYGGNIKMETGFSYFLKPDIILKNEPFIKLILKTDAETILEEELILDYELLCDSL